VDNADLLIVRAIMGIEVAAGGFLAVVDDGFLSAIVVLVLRVVHGCGCSFRAGMIVGRKTERRVLCMGREGKGREKGRPVKFANEGAIAS